MSDEYMPTISEIVEIENQRVKDAVRACHGFGMDQGTLVGTVMKYLKGKANPALVVGFARQYLENGCRFKS